MPPFGVSLGPRHLQIKMIAASANARLARYKTSLRPSKNPASLNHLTISHLTTLSTAPCAQTRSLTHK